MELQALCLVAFAGVILLAWVGLLLRKIRDNLDKVLEAVNEVVYEEE